MTLGASFEDLLTAARAGGAWAWEALYRELAPLVLGYLRSRGARDPEDLTGEVFVTVVSRIGDFEGGERDMRAWVMTIAHRRLVDEYRRRGRESTDPVEHKQLEAQGPTGDVEREALVRFDVGRVRELMRLLTSDQQDVVLLRLLGDMTVDEVAEALGKRPGAVKALQHRALNRLRREISKLGVSI